MADDHDKEDKEHKEAGPRKKTRKIVDTEIIDITDTKPHVGGKTVMWILGAVLLVGLLFAVNQQTWPSLTSNPVSGVGSNQSATVNPQTSECTVRQKTIPLDDRGWVEINPKGCKVVWSDGNVLGGAPRTPAYPLKSAGLRNPQMIKSPSGTRSFTYSLCPADGVAANWDCSPITKTAGR